MAKKEYYSLPDDYPVCQHADCPMAGTCLHQESYAKLLVKAERLQLINPTCCTKDSTCAYYRSDRPVTYARGFEQFQKRMYPDQYRQFTTICINHWSRTPYYERRRGDRSLPPNEQAFIRKALKRVGVEDDWEFDAYEERNNWYD